TRQINAKRILEVGSFTGRTSLALAESSIGKVTTIDIDSTGVERIGRGVWEENRANIEFLHGNALDVLYNLRLKNEKFDFIFVDADKKSYLEYFSSCLFLLDAHGLLVFDNVLWRGEVAEVN